MRSILPYLKILVLPPLFPPKDVSLIVFKFCTSTSTPLMRSVVNCAKSFSSARKIWPHCASSWTPCVTWAGIHFSNACYNTGWVFLPFPDHTIESCETCIEFLHKVLARISSSSTVLSILLYSPIHNSLIINLSRNWAKMQGPCPHLSQSRFGGLGESDMITKMLAN